MIPLLAKPIRIGLVIRLADIDIGHSKERGHRIVRVRLLDQPIEVLHRTVTFLLWYQLLIVIIIGIKVLVYLN